MKKRILSGLLAFTMLITLIHPQTFVFADDSETTGTQDVPVVAESASTSVLNSLLRQAGDKYSDADEISIIVQINDAVMSEKHGLLAPGIENVRTTEGLKAQLSYAEDSQGVLQSVMDAASLQYEIIEHYDTVLNGLALSTTFEQAKQIAQLEEIQSIEVNRTIPAPSLQEFNSHNTKDAHSNAMVHAQEAWQKKYTGKTSFIAIIDSGADPDHEAFKLDGTFEVGENALDEAGIKELMKEKGIDKGQYFNQKIPFGFNYAERNTKIKELSESSHGMHVAGIVAANSRKLKGVAPNAQLAVMRVFGGGLFGGGTTPIIYNKAIDDAVKLGVDSINMSLGSTGTTDSRLEDTTKAALENARRAGIVVAIAAGNDGFMGFGAMDGPSPNNPNYGLINSPSVADVSMSVASVDNSHIEQKAILIQNAQGETIQDKILYEATDDKEVSEEFISFVHVGMGYDEDYKKLSTSNTQLGPIKKIKSVEEIAQKSDKSNVTKNDNEAVDQKSEASEELKVEEKSSEQTKKSETNYDQEQPKSVIESEAVESPVLSLSLEEKQESPAETGDKPKTSEEILSEESLIVEEENSDQTEAVEEKESASENTDSMSSEELEDNPLKAEESEEAGEMQTLANADLTDKLKGKYALIMRGEKPGDEFTFHAKILKAQKAGAIGAIIYNNTDSKTLIKMAFENGDDITIPSFFISKEDGEFLVRNSDYKLKFSKQNLVVANPTSYFVSNFSSWGMTEEGNFKPDISAPGGKIYSSINNNKYLVMSGTSMATPHVAGGIAVVKEYVENTFPEVDGIEKHKLVKNILMSTATPHKFTNSDEAVDFGSPRGQGAGLMDLKRAVDADVVVLGTNGVSSISLGDIKGDTVTVKGELKNYGKEERTYSYYGVLSTDKVEAGHVTLSPKVLVNGKNDRKLVTVKSGETAAFEYSFKVNTDVLNKLKEEMPNGYFLEGYIFFESPGGMHNVNVPFVGFKGVWDDLSVLEPTIYDLLSKNRKPIYYEFADRVEHPYTYLATYIGGKLVALGESAESTFKNPKFDKNKIAFSPNDDGRGDVVTFYGTFLRNYKGFQMTVFEEVNKVKSPIYKVDGGVDFGMKSYFTVFGGPNMNHTKERWKWDGKKSNGEAAIEGKYIMQIKVKPDGKSEKVQTMEIPIILDLSTPRIVQSSLDASKRNFTLHEYEEKGSGLKDAYIEYVGQNEKNEVVFKKVRGTGQGSKNFALPEGISAKDAKFFLVDYAGNTLSLPLESAVRTGNERSILVDPVLQDGVITSDKFKYEIRDSQWNLVENQYDVQPGEYTVVVNYIDKDYKLVETDNKFKVVVKESDRDVRLKIHFTRKGKGKATVSVNHVPRVSLRIFLVNTRNGEEYELVPAPGTKSPFEGYVPPGDYKIVTTNYDKSKYFITTPLGDDMKIIEGSEGTKNNKEKSLSQVHINYKNMGQGTINLERNSYEGALDLVLSGTDQDRTQYTVHFDKGEKTKSVKIPYNLVFNVYLANMEDATYGIENVKTVFYPNQSTFNLEIRKGVQNQQILVDKSLLEIYIKQSDLLLEDKYTLDSWEKFEAVLYEAQMLFESEVSSQDAINQMVIKLKEAIEKLEERIEGASKEDLRIKLEEAQQIYNSLDDQYTEKSREFLSAAIEGATITYKSNDPEKNTEKHIKATIDMLDRAIQALERVDKSVNLEPLKALIRKVDEIVRNRDNYKPDDVIDKLIRFKEQAVKLIETPKPDSKKVQTHMSLLRSNLGKVESKANRSKLEAELNIAKTIKLKEYKLETRKPYRLALQEAKEMMAKKLATQAEIDKACETLSAKRKLLVKIKDDGQGETPSPQNPQQPQQPEQPQQPQNPGNQDQNTGNVGGGAGGGSGSPSGGGESAPAPKKEKIDETKSPLSKIAKDLLDKANEKAEKLPFADLEEKHWAYNSVKFVYEKELLKGISKDEFMPEGMVSRAMMATILYRLSGEKATGLKTEFKDLEAGSWYEEAVIWCKANKIVDGYNNEMFGPNDLISREQMIKMIYAYVKFKDVKIKDISKELDLSDRDQISPFAKESMEWAISQGIINGMSDGKIHPKERSNRAQLAAVLEKFVKYLE